MVGAKRIVFAGKKGHGKDTAAEALRLNITEYSTNPGWTVVKFADPLKKMLYTMLEMQGVDKKTMQRMIEGDLKEEPTPYFAGKTPRHAMQTMGTEWGRDLISPQLWTGIWERRTDRLTSSVTTDMRFFNECEAAKRVGSFTIRIVNPRKKDNAASEHPSETAVMALPVHCELMNDGTIKALYEKVLAATFDYRTT